MSLQWYPGHMTKARRELAQLIPSQGLIIEVLDARLPLASTNPMINDLARDKPRLKLLTKSDLADPAATRDWLAALTALPHTLAMTTNPDRAADTRKRIVDAIARLGLRHTKERALRALIVGVPNVGKSTLINVLMDRPVAKTGDKPAVTKVQQRVVTPNGLIVTDSPGLMWPKIEDEAGAFSLAFAGSIPDTAIDYFTIGLFGARALLARYPELLVARFKLAAVPESPEALLAEIARRRGGLKPGGEADLHKASEILVREFRHGSLGPVTLEAPPAAG